MPDNVLNDIVKQATKLHIARTTVFDAKGHVKRGGNANQVGSTLKVIEDILPDIMEALKLQSLAESCGRMSYALSEAGMDDEDVCDEVRFLWAVTDEMKCFKTNPLTGKMERVAE
jgi:hypothetical protein